jgi:dihydroneopterin aldolase
MTIFIHNLVCNVIIGILPQERIAPQSLRCNIEITYEGKHYVDYAKVKSIVEKLLEEQKFQLLEEAIEYLQQFLKQQYSNIMHAKYTLEKLDIFENCTVGATQTYTYTNF